jgi:hypothetical protein
VAYTYAHRRARPLGARLRSSHLGTVAPPAAVAALAEAISAARDALRELAVLGATLERTATHPATAEAGRVCKRFGSEVGPRLINEAEAVGDGAKVARVQGSVIRLIEFCQPEVVSSVVRRFMLMAIPFVGPGLAVLPPSTMNAAKEAGQTAVEEVLPEVLTKREEADKFVFYIKLGLGLGAIVAVAYALNTIRGFAPKSE